MGEWKDTEILNEGRFVYLFESNLKHFKKEIMADISGSGMDKHIWVLKKICSFLSGDLNVTGYFWVSSWSDKRWGEIKATWLILAWRKIVLFFGTIIPSQ